VFCGNATGRMPAVCSIELGTGAGLLLAFAGKIEQSLRRAPPTLSAMDSRSTRFLWDCDCADTCCSSLPCLWKQKQCFSHSRQIESPSALPETGDFVGMRPSAMHAVTRPFGFRRRSSIARVTVMIAWRTTVLKTDRQTSRQAVPSHSYNPRQREGKPVKKAR
jgi:hypothetical protein